MPAAPSVVQLIGPGGAGKSTAGRALAQRLGWQFVDLDQQFMEREGDIARCIATHGYAGYALRNVAVHCAVRAAFIAPTVHALSSGFMTYAASEIPGYAQVRSAIELDALTVLLLPSFELEACVETIVQRQLARPYLQCNGARESARMRERFPVFMALQCARFRRDDAPQAVASRIEHFVRERLDLPLVLQALRPSSPQASLASSSPCA